MAPIKSDLHGELRKQNLALEDQSTKLIQDKYENKDQVQVLSTIKKSKNKKQSGTISLRPNSNHGPLAL